jgi:soluble lytic murein transglycosylase-like protein
MTAFPKWDTWRVIATDVVNGVRHVSHNALALLGLAALTAVLFLAGRPDLRDGVETRALGWLSERATARLSIGLTGSQARAEEKAPDILLAMAEPDAIARATAADMSELNRQQVALVNWISRRYSVAQEPISRLVQEAWSVGKVAGVEPTLILAVMAVESSFNPFAQSHVGAQGLMQVMTGIHHDKYEIFGGKRAAFDPVTNLRVGVQVLRECIARAGGLEAGLKYYVGAANMANDGGYAAKVLAEQAYLREVVAGHKVPTNASLPQANLALIEASASGTAGTVATPQVAVAPAEARASTPSERPAVAGPANLSTPAATPAAPAASEAAPAPVARHPEQVALLTAH